MSNDVPKDWTMRPLAFLADYHNGRAFKPDELSKEGLPVIRIAQINNPSAEYDHYSGSDISEKNLVRDGELLFSWSATLTALIWNRGDAILNQHIFKVVEKEGVDKHYLHQLLANSIEALAEHSHGSTMKHIKKSVLSDYVVPVPKLLEQQKIATILSSVDDVIETTRAQINKLKDLKTGMMQELLTQGIGHTEFKDSPVGRIPKSWRIVKVEDIQNPGKYSCVGGPFGSDLTSKDYVPEPGVPVIRGVNLPSDFRRFHERDFVYVTNEKADVLFKSLAWRGDFVFTQRGTLGQVGMIPDDSIFDRFLISQSQMKLSVDRSILDKEFLYQYFLSEYFHRQIKQETIATGLPHINLGILKSFWVPLPSISEQRKIAQILGAIDERMACLLHVVENYKAMKKALMQDLLTGKVRVNVDQKEPEVA